MKAKKAKPVRILLVDKFVNPAQVSGDLQDVFTATVATLDPDDGKPRNWSRPYFDERFPGDTGGFSLRAFISSTDKSILSFITARGVCSGDADEYLEAAKAIAAMQKRDAKLAESLGYARGAAEILIRQIFTLDVSAVFIRPEGLRETWLSSGEWKRYTVGEFANLIRRAYPTTPTA